MPKKRKNNGKNRANRGNVGYVRCDVSARAVPKDKAIKRFIVRNLVDSSGQKDIRDKSVYTSYTIPKMYYKAYYCVSTAIHNRIVRPRNAENRKNRNPPAEVLKRWAQQQKRAHEAEMRKVTGNTRGGRGRGGRGGFGQRGGGRGGPRGGGAGRGRGGGGGDTRNQ